MVLAAVVNVGRLKTLSDPYDSDPYTDHPKQENSYSREVSAAALNLHGVGSARSLP
jgi:hypothetical protein